MLLEEERQMKKTTPALLAGAAVLAITAAAGIAAQSAAAGTAPSPAETLDPLPETGEVTPSPVPTGTLGPEPTPIPQPTLTGAPQDPGLPMPLDAYMTSMDDIHTIDLARDAATADCMRSLGFTAWTAGVVRSWEPEDYQEADLLEPLDPAAAAQSGYPRPQPDPAVAAAAQRPADQRAATPEEMQAYSGTADTTASGQDIPEGGCSASGEARILGADTTLAADPRALADDSGFLALEHSDVQRALAGWTTCMTGKGYAYDSPMSARNDLRWAARQTGASATDLEKRVAAADAACARDTGLLATYRTAKRAYQTLMVNDRRQALTESLAAFGTWVRHAETILTGE
jgi:hypothetical protein